MSIRDQFDKAEAALLAIGDVGSTYTTIDVRPNEARVNVWPGKAYHAAATQALLRFAGKLTKGSYGEVGATKDGVTIILFGVLVCEQVGTETVERPVMKSTGETETIEKPIYRCRLPFETAEAI